MKQFKTFAPLFSGFYESMWAPDFENIEYNNEQEIKEGNLENVIDTDKFNWKDYTNSVASTFVYQLTSELKSNGIVNAITFEEVISPKYYNFTTDSINILVDMSEENILNLQNHIKENIDVYRERIKEEHTSYDGFISFTSNNIDEWDQQTDGFRDFEVKSGKYYLGFLLGVYCDIEGIKEDDLYDWCNVNEILYNSID